ncbi:MAG: DUF262 domain-containing protein [Candidatus Schekmanbacteria bacterium]|nr:DUF262 domain-containing protein [Candidatus Schekmanbacteria bacterium]
MSKTPAPTPQEAREEYFESTPTGVEVEDDSPPSANDPEPWDPEKIRVHTKHFSLRQLVDMIADEDVDLAPDFQRLYVWKDWQRSALIESLLLGIPLPSFYLNENSDGKMQVVDGVQRLTTIFMFVNTKSFKLKELTYLKAIENCGFDDLDPMYRRRLQTSQFVAHVIDPQTPYRVKFEIFRRINTGGTPLSAQEIRHCMSLKRSRDFLKELAADKSFLDATGQALKNHPRLADREIVLRFLAFSIYSVDDYADIKGFDDFLGKATEYLDRNATDEQLTELRDRFQKGMRLAYEVFGEHAFRKWPQGPSERRNPINRALVETWGTVLASCDEALVLERVDTLVERARELMTADFDPTFISAIVGSTSDIARVRYRFSKVNELAREVLE